MRSGSAICLTLATTERAKPLKAMGSRTATPYSNFLRKHIQVNQADTSDDARMAPAHAGGQTTSATVTDMEISRA